MPYGTPIELTDEMLAMVIHPHEKAQRILRNQMRDHLRFMEKSDRLKDVAENAIRKLLPGGAKEQ